MSAAILWELDWDPVDEEFVIQPAVVHDLAHHITTRCLHTAIDILYEKNYVDNGL